MSGNVWEWCQDVLRRLDQVPADGTPCSGRATSGDSAADVITTGDLSLHGLVALRHRARLARRLHRVPDRARALLEVLAGLENGAGRTSRLRRPTTPTAEGKRVAASRRTDVAEAQRHQRREGTKDHVRRAEAGTPTADAPPPRTRRPAHMTNTWIEARCLQQS